VELKTPAAASAGTSAVPQATLVAASAIRAFLETQRLPMPPVGAAASTKDSLVRLICVRR
jgi:hypothetical protein